MAVVEKVQDLCRLAQSSNENEARSAALQAVRLMNEHDLAFVPKTELEAAMRGVQGAQELVRQTKAENQKSMLVGALVGALVGKQFL